MGETRVDLLHLLEDLRDAYPGSIEETILTEIVANSLDSGASEITVRADPVAETLTVTDNGTGMSRQALARYHDLASTSKRRGRSIGFAGVGIKLGLLVSEQVVTETRRARTHLATSWHLSSKSRAPWRWIEPPGLQEAAGTTVRLYLRNPLSELLEPGFIDSTILRHFRPLLDPDFDELLGDAYPLGARFVVNDRPLHRDAPEPDRVAVRVRIGRQRKPSGIGYLARDAGLDPEQRGIAISTLGKVIKRGWDWLGLTPGDADRVSGLIEVPALVEALTLNKADFVKTGQKGVTFLAYRKALQEAVARQLEEWGDSPRPSDTRPRRTRALERDLRSVLADLTDDYPILTTLVDRLRGGQRKLPFVGEGGRRGDGVTPIAAAKVGQRDAGAAGGLTPEAGGLTPEAGGLTPEAGGLTPEAGGVTPGREATGPLAATVAPGGNSGRKRPGRFGLTVQFASRPDDPELGALVDSTLWVNDAHPAYRRAVASRSEGYHIALTMALTIAPLAVEPGDTRAFVTTFLTRWGDTAKLSG
jgi:hypothetical protein